MDSSGQDKYREGQSTRRRRVRFATVEPYLYIAPALLLLVVFKFWPMIFGLALSVLKWNFVSATKEFVGLSNYLGMFARDTFLIALKNTLLYILALLPFYLVLPLALAVLLGSIRSPRMAAIYKAVIFAPAVLSFAITCMVWLWIFNPLYGVLNRLLALIGLPGVSWLSDATIALWAIVLVSGWKTFGYNMVLLIAALSSVSKQYVEVAQIDGATSWQIFWKIKWPLISPTMFFLLVTTMIFTAERAFVPINILTKGGPYEATTNLSFAIYLFGFHYFDAGLASATATFTFALFLLITLFEVRYLERYVTYEV